MKRLLLFFYLLLLSFTASFAQADVALNIIESYSIPRQKFDSYVAKKGFRYAGSSYSGDTVAKDYAFKGIEKKIATDSLLRRVTVFNSKKDFCFAYHTACINEFKKILNDIKKEGFYCKQENDALASCLFYQKNDVTVTVSSKPADTLMEYSFIIHKQILPRPREIKYAEDLFAFDSHEQLKYYFGEENVKKDIYYLSENKAEKCSIIFANTNRQVVFLWADEINDANLAKLYIGGQLMAKSSLEYDKNVGENQWQLKSGIRPGMSLYQLRQLNDAAFNFNGGNSATTGMIAAEGTGKIDFKKESIILGCINCNDAAFYKKNMVNSDDAIKEERILFVHTIILDPLKTK